MLAADLIPAISAPPGCERATFFGDHADGEYGLYVLWDSEENAGAAARLLGRSLASIWQGMFKGL